MYIDKTQSVNKEFILVNIMEDFVRRRVKEALKEAEMCQCSLCELNVCAITLNSLSPRYVTTQKGHLLAQVAMMNPDSQQEVDIQISKAIKIVHENLRH